MKKQQLHIGRNLLLTGLLLASATLSGAVFQQWELQESNIVVVYLFSVLLIARFTHGYCYGIGASIISLLLFNWFFTKPYFTLKVHDMTYLITFAIMMVTSVVTSTLTTTTKQATADARERERESNALYQMTNHLTDAENTEAIGQIAIHTTSEVLDCPTAFICFDPQGNPERTFMQQKPDGSLIRRELRNPAELRQRMEQLHGAVDCMDGSHLYPVYGKSMLLGVLCIPQDIGSALTASQTRMLHAIMESAALALERLRSLQEQVRSREETAQERYRANLLRAISHDIRTPLSGIMGTSEMLMHAAQPDDLPYALANDIYRDAQGLYGMVENILSLTRLQDGKLTLKKQPEAVEEVIGAALLVIEKRCPTRSIDVAMPDDVVMVPMDAGLIRQVLINLLDNANKHTAPEQPISIFVDIADQEVRLTVADRGSGIPEEDFPHIFQMFYTTSGRRPDSKRGVGLGLAICQSIVAAHGGVIWAENRAEGGAAFTFTLPLGGALE